MRQCVCAGNFAQIYVECIVKQARLCEYNACWLIVFNWCHSNDDDDDDDDDPSTAAAAAAAAFSTIMLWLIPSIYMLCFDMLSLVMSQPQIIIYIYPPPSIFKFLNDKGLSLMVFNVYLAMYIVQCMRIKISSESNPLEFSRSTPKQQQQPPAVHTERKIISTVSRLTFPEVHRRCTWPSTK